MCLCKITFVAIPWELIENSVFKGIGINIFIKSILLIKVFRCFISLFLVLPTWSKNTILMVDSHSI